MLVRKPEGAKEWTATVTGILVLGAIGSGLWDKLGDPLFVLVRDALLSAATLGLHTLKDSLYQDVALGLHEEPSTLLLMFTFMALAITPIVTLFGNRFREKEYRRQRQLSTKAAGSQEDFNEVMAELKIMDQKATRQLRILTFISMPVLALLISTTMFSCVKLMYTVRAIAHYRQLVMIIEPYVDDGVIKTYDSRFAQISSANEYMTLVGELRQIAEKNHLRAPTFTIW